MRLTKLMQLMQLMQMMLLISKSMQLVQNSASSPLAVVSLQVPLLPPICSEDSLSPILASE